MKKLDVPGVGLAFVEDGRVVWEGGLGVKELGKPDAVDAETLFMAASNTKGMTTLLLAKLVDEGKVRAILSIPDGFERDLTLKRPVTVQVVIDGAYRAPPQDIVDKVTALRQVADAHKVPLGAAALQFALAHPVICSVLTGPKSVAELNGIIDWWNTPIPSGFWRDLADKKLVADGTPLPQ